MNNSQKNYKIQRCIFPFRAKTNFRLAIELVKIGSKLFNSTSREIEIQRRMMHDFDVDHQNQSIVENV
jgi:hypothetical protein